MNLIEVIENPHFIRLAAMLRYPFLSQEWRDEHPTVAYWQQVEGAKDLIKPELIATESGKKEALSAVMGLLVSVTQADPDLSYSVGDLEWLVMAIQDKDVATWLSMLFAYFSAPSEYLTPAEAAERSGMSESTWRNRAADDELPGAIKRGKQWLIPVRLVSKK